MGNDIETLRGFSRMREDPDWFGKIMLGALFTLSTMCIPILGSVVLMGWTTLILRRAVHGIEAPLPELTFDFDYLGKLLGIGFKGFIVGFVWMLPFIVIIGGITGCMYGSVIMSVISSQGGPPPEPPTGLLIGFAAVMLGSIPVQIVVRIFSRVATMRAELTDNLNEGFAFSAVMHFVKAMWWELLVGMLILGFVGGAVFMLGYVCCLVGVFPALVVVSVVDQYFLAQIYLRYVAKGNPPWAIVGPYLEAPAQAS